MPLTFHHSQKEETSEVFPSNLGHGIRQPVKIPQGHLYTH